jgi:hypothetical protein
MRSITPEPNGNFYNSWSETPRHNLMRMVKYDPEARFEARPSDRNIGIAVLGAWQSDRSLQSRT